MMDKKQQLLDLREELGMAPLSEKHLKALDELNEAELDQLMSAYELEASIEKEDDEFLKANDPEGFDELEDEYKQKRDAATNAYFAKAEEAEARYDEQLDQLDNEEDEEDRAQEKQSAADMDQAEAEMDEFIKEVEEASTTSE